MSSGCLHPHPPPPFLPYSGPFNSQSHSSGLPSTLDSLRFGWIDCLAPALHWLHALSSNAHKPRDGNFSLCLHLWLQILLLPSSLRLRRPQDCDIYRQLSPAPTGQRPRHRPQRQHLDDNTPTRFPVEPPESRLRVPTSSKHTAPHRNTKQDRDSNNNNNSILGILQSTPPRPPRAAVSILHSKQNHDLLWRMT